MYTANKSIRKQLLVIILGVAVAVLISINMTKAEGIVTTDKIASLVDRSTSNASITEMEPSTMIVVYDKTYNEVFKLEVDEESKEANIHLSRFLSLCDFVMEINNTFIYLLKK